MNFNSGAEQTFSVPPHVETLIAVFLSVVVG